MVNTQIPTQEGRLIKQGPNFKTSRTIKRRRDFFRSGIIGEFVQNSGQYLILPRGTMIFNGIKAMLRQYLAEDVGFEEVVLPKIAPVETFRKAGLLGKWDRYLISVKPFSATNGVDREYLMDPLQCIVFYQFYEGRKVDTSNGPIRWYDISGPTYRNEDIDKLKAGIRQREFHRAEFVYSGTREQVIQTREMCLTRIEILCRDLGLNYRVVVGAGCYLLNDRGKRIPKSLDEIPIKDLEIYCPEYKNKSKEPYVEVAGSAVLADTLTSRFNITGKNGECLWSGCTGIGLNRLMYALISNYGTELEEMPLKLQEATR